MTWLAAALVVGGFLWLLHLLRVPPRAADVVARARDALRVLRSRELGDEAKEAAMQAHAKAMFGQFFVITAAAAVALAAPLAALYALHAAGLVAFDAALERTVSWPVLVGATVIGLATWRALRGRG